MKIVKLLFVLFSILYLSYLALPSPDYPSPPPDALQSHEPADSETALRRAYFTDMTRQEVLEHYQRQLACGTASATNTQRQIPDSSRGSTTVRNDSFDGIWCKIPFLTYRLNYPPEEAYGIIRDQTRSTFLEEIVHPFRESVYVNGFEPKTDKDRIFIEGKEWRQKITVRWVPSKIYARLGIGALTFAAMYLVYRSLIQVITLFRRNFRW